MEDLKSWLEQAGEPVEETCFVPGEAPQFPYIVFLDTVERVGGDTKNMAKQHSVAVERYSDGPEDNLQLEALFDKQAIKYTKDRQWLSNEECFLTIYNFEIFEREVL
ncbi:hypothetical protein [Sporanaerobacter sp. PP17-6a]|uniref:hypothetical protein n=1 Tax=Sporanaerobacter sp. PP17-6a TaxID=1891289 RepID=UPI0008A00180|nr:hypothetical protein [Sporanaerobacter sp. PP17-6a]SCL88025.1 hypothetical protein PP176A_1446 [Sporanaerobacter sp. PP17-6a]